MFLNGQKVVCIDDKFPLGIEKFYTAMPTEGTTYTIRGMAPAINFQGEDDLAVYLVGLQNPCSEVAPHRERGFKPERFRELEELTTEEILAVHAPKEAFVGQ